MAWGGRGEGPGVGGVRGPGVGGVRGALGGRGEVAWDGWLHISCIYNEHNMVKLSQLDLKSPPEAAPSPPKNADFGNKNSIFSKNNNRFLLSSQFYI